MEESEAGFTGRRLNSKMQVYSGSKTAYLPKMMTLHEQCIRVLSNNIDCEYGSCSVLLTLPSCPTEVPVPRMCHTCSSFSLLPCWVAACSAAGFSAAFQGIEPFPWQGRSGINTVCVLLLSSYL